MIRYLSLDWINALSDEVTASDTMREIVGNADRIQVMIKEISSAAQEQNSGVTRVTDSVNQLDAMTQQNAALVEQMAAAASRCTYRFIRADAPEEVENIASVERHMAELMRVPTIRAGAGTCTRGQARTIGRRRARWQGWSWSP